MRSKNPAPTLTPTPLCAPPQQHRHCASLPMLWLSPLHQQPASPNTGRQKKTVKGTALASDTVLTTRDKPGDFAQANWILSAVFSSAKCFLPPNALPGADRVMSQRSVQHGRARSATCEPRDLGQISLSCPGTPIYKIRITVVSG